MPNLQQAFSTKNIYSHLQKNSEGFEKLTFRIYCTIHKARKSSGFDKKQNFFKRWKKGRFCVVADGRNIIVRLPRLAF